MNRRRFLAGLGAGAAALGWNAGAQETRGARPNILWITCEDISPNLGCYGDAYACTPNLDALAAEGIRYANAFSHAPVCAPARSGLITGLYPTAFGSHNMRCSIQRPPEIRCFPEYLRETGYFCTNHSKTDYNFTDFANAWDECSDNAHWRHRRPGQPFFSVINFLITHESRIRAADDVFFRDTRDVSAAQRHDPKKAPLPPYHPDTPEVRQDWARYADNITQMDCEVRRVLDELAADGLADNTIVFFYGDHGAGMPRSKRWLYDTGLRVPLLLRFPERWRHFAPGAPGSVEKRLVSFVDFAPTVLSLAGSPVPEAMQGRAFLGTHAAAPRTHVYAARDRMDERYDCTRAVRDGHYKYIRNFMPQVSQAQHNEYMYEMPTMKVWDRLAKEGGLKAVQSAFLLPCKPVEEFYDTEADPWEVKNLAGAPEHADRIGKMRQALYDWMIETADLGLCPEGEIDARRGTRPPRSFGKDTKDYPLARILETADLERGAKGNGTALVTRCTDADSAVRYWAVTGLAVANAATPEVLTALRARLEDNSGDVRVAAVQALHLLGERDGLLPVLEAAIAGDSPWVRLRALTVLDDLGPLARPLLPKVRAIADQDIKGFEAREAQYSSRVANHIVATLGAA
jgi:uncharacterized sulfatase